MLVYHYLCQEFALKNIRERRLKISRLTDLNDPFEFLGVDLTDPGFRELVARTKEELSRANGLLCFSRSWNSPLLWGHYADKHKGICLGFEIPNRLLRRVKYASTRLRKPKVPDEAFVKRLLFIKFEHWSYEEEYRLYVSLNKPEGEHHYAGFSEEMALREVIVGDQATATRADVLEAVGDLQDQVEVLKVRPSFKHFRVVRNQREESW